MNKEKEKQTDVPEETPEETGTAVPAQGQTEAMQDAQTAENPPENAERPQDETENDAETDGAAHEPENITGVPGTETVPAPAAGTVPAIGEDMESTAENTGEAPPGRDREAEWKELAAAHPEIVGETLPEDIYRECMISELPPIRVYESMMMKKQADRIHALEAELAQLRQNAETAARAPVMGTANAPAPAENDDPFLRGFNAYR